MAARPVPAAPTARADEECAALYRRHGAEILRYCQRKLRERADAEDVTQQVFVRAYGALLRGERVRLPRHWLLRIARNECRRFAARRWRVEEVEFDEAIDVLPEEEVPRWSPDEIRRALDELVPAQRQALVLRELEGRPYAEIARELRLTVSAVETLLFRARRSLREQLDGTLACDAAEQALSLDLDGRLPEADKPGLRAHLRACDDCSRLARRHRARRHALRTLLPVPLQGQLASLVGGGGTVVGAGGAVAKVAALVAAGAASTTVGITAARPAEDPTQPALRITQSTQVARAPIVRIAATRATGARPRVASAQRTRPAGTGAATTSPPVKVGTPGESATPTVTVAAEPGGTAPAATPGGAPAGSPTTAPATTAPAEQDPVAAVEKTVDTLVPAVQVPEPQLPPVQPPPLPVDPPPLPPLPPTPLDQVLPDLPGGLG